MTQATVEIRAEGTDRVSATSRTEPAIDDRTVERLRGGDRAAFDALYRAYAGRIHAFSLRLCGAGAGGSRPGDRTAAAEEIVQEVFVRVWQHRRKIAGRLHLERWLHRVAINLRRNAQRTEARRGGPDATLTAEPEDRGGTPGPRTSALRSDLEQAVRALPDGAREVLLLHDVHGYRHAEIADRLGCAVGTSKAQLHRARKRLREVLGS